MSEDQLKAFLEKVKSDTSLQEKLKGAADADAALAIAKEAGFAITAEDIQSMQSSSVELDRRYSVELSDEELESAAGGRSTCVQNQSTASFVYYDTVGRNCGRNVCF